MIVVADDRAMGNVVDPGGLLSAIVVAGWVMGVPLELRGWAAGGVGEGRGSSSGGVHKRGGERGVKRRGSGREGGQGRGAEGRGRQGQGWVGRLGAGILTADSDSPSLSSSVQWGTGEPGFC